MSGDFHVLKGSMEWQIGQVCDQNILQGPFCALTENVKTCVCLHPFIMAWYVRKCCLSSVKSQNLHAVFAAAFLGVPG